MQASGTLRLPVAELLAAAVRRPQAEALRHKRRGVWQAWSWADVLARTDRLAEALRARGVVPDAVVAVSGEYAPVLVLVAIAATHLGATVLTVPTQPGRAALAAWVAAQRPALVFLGLRNQVGAWRAALGQAGLASPLVVDAQLPWGHPGSAGFTPASDLLGDAGGTPARAASDVLWIEEATDWTDGLSYILHAAAAGRALAFPESRLAAHRDRRETQPVAAAVSPPHQAALSAGLAARLPTGRGVAARLTRAALAAGRDGRAGWPQRWLLRRLRRPFGLARLRELTVVGADGQEAAGDLFAALGITPAYAPPPAAARPAAQGLAFA
jgi:hypothetical protein